MAENESSAAPIRRIPIQKCRVCDILSSTPSDGGGTFFESPSIGTIARIHIFGMVTDTYVSGDKNYAFFSVDDTTGTIRCKAFGNTAIAAEIKTGQSVDVIGRIREYNNERYVMPEIIRVSTDPNLETLRWLEILKILKNAPAKDAKTEAAIMPVENPAEIKEPSDTEKKEEQKEDKNTGVPKDARAKILEIISTANGGEGAEHNAIVAGSGLAQEIVDAIITELLSEGTCYEPRPGKIKLL